MVGHVHTRALDARAQETLRMYPPVAVGQIRVSSRDLSLAGQLTLPAGTALWVPTAALHMAAHNWPQPEAFLPGARARPSAGLSPSPEARVTGAQAAPCEGCTLGSAV